MEQTIKKIKEMQKEAKEEAKLVEAGKIKPPMGLTAGGYEHYCEGWDDALKSLLESIK